MGLGRVFRKLGLPMWTFLGVGIAAIWFNYIGSLLERFTRDMDVPETQARVTSDRQRGESVDISGTPTLFVNGLEISEESMSAEGIRATINAALAGKKP